MIVARSLHVAIALVATAGLLSLGGCSTETIRDLQEADRQACEEMGLRPGSPRYEDCVSTGAARYARDYDPDDYDHGYWGGGRNNRCTAPASPNGKCSGCQVSCGTNQQASCEQGQEWPDGSSCMRDASCDCR
jgi:hypothetical protein